MNRISGWNHRGAEVRLGEGPSAEADDAGLMRRVRELAVASEPRGRARLRLAPGALRRLEGSLEAARRLKAAGVAGDEPLERLLREARLMEACARRAEGEGGQRLPACGGAPRLSRLMEALCADGEARLTEDRLMLALAAYDDVQALDMAELWAAPAAARVAVAGALARTAAAIAARAGACARAEAWLDRPVGGLGRRGAAFYEHALRRAAERELPAVRGRLERCLRARGESPEAVIRAAHARRAALLLRLDNLLAAARLLDALNWKRGFEALSAVDRALRGDPADVYARMDDASRATVRGEVSAIARGLGLSELTVARHAVAAAAERGESEPAATVCWWLVEDAGRRALLARLGLPGRRLPRRVPDPTGLGCGAALIGLSAALLAGFAAAVDSPWLWPAGAPLAWMAANALAARLYPRWFPPARLLKLELDRVPEDCRALVTLPVLLSDPERAAAACDRLEALGCLEGDENVEFLLLGDFADGPRAEAEGDADIVAAVRARVDEMNARAGRAKYAYLQRPRTRLEPDGRWMGLDRKRGALMALNRVLLGAPGAEAAFSVAGEACGRLRGRFAYVVTLDADTRMLPGDVRTLVGAMAHPLNRPGRGRGYAVLQPRMETVPSACANAFVRLFAGAGGLSAYPVTVSSLWQDLTGAGIYAGKGIYDVAAFHAALEGALPEGRVLSHDLVEGAIAGAGFLGDVALYDGSPATLDSHLRRLHRWTRGDWQLLPVLCARGPLPNGRRLAAADRLRMADNLLRSLAAPALLAALIGAAWTGDAGALALGLGFSFLQPLLNLFGGDRLKWRRATAELAILPLTAWCTLDAALRTLWRLGVSGRHLMDWVTAADAERSARSGLALPGYGAAALVLPGALVPGMAPAALGLAALFAVGPGWVRDMALEPVEAEPALTARQAASLASLARDTWRFFEECVPPDGCGLPPDNVQLDPPRGAARRTSPTNIGLYMTGALAACRLGFIRPESLHARLAAALDAIDRAERWRGHLYNWIDLDSLSALRPRYVSAVDSGNLAAALLACASALERGELAAPELSARLRTAARRMDFAALYDGERELFYIGVDAETGRPSQSHYDLLASEARILSYVAMMLGQAPVRHWLRLGRTCVPAAGGCALASWSGTMFEYLMPELFLDAPALSLLGQSARTAVRAQRGLGARLGRPWGVSESGYCAFDAQLNYQYRAFGLRALALGGDAAEGVVAPYASALAAPIAPGAAAENLEAMRALGWSDDCGLYEAADYLRPQPDGGPGLVKSHMAHHQGMALCALCNALTNGALRADFMRQPEARALSLLLEERPVGGVRLRRRAAPEPIRSASEPSGTRRARPGERLAETHLLHGAGATALATADGAIHYARDGVDATRFSGDLLNRRDGACLHLRNADTGAAAVLGGPDWRTDFDAGAVRVRGSLGEVEASVTVALSPEDGTLLRAVELRNTGGRPARLCATDVAPVALSGPADWRAHATFRKIFVECERLSRCALRFRCRPRSTGERRPALVHAACAPGEIRVEASLERLVGRAGDVMRPGGVPEALSDRTDTGLDPVSAIQASFTLEPGERVRLHFALALLEPEASAAAWLERCLAEGLPGRAQRLAAARARAMLDFLGLSAGQHHLLQRMAALLWDGRLAAEARGERRPAEISGGREALWAAGISGDWPMLAMTVTHPDQAANAREAIRAHAFYRAMGVRTELALIDDCGGGYDRPARDALMALIDSGCPGALNAPDGGVRVLDGGQLAAVRRAAILRGASALFSGGRDFYAQVRELLAPLDVPARPASAPLEPGCSLLPPRAGEAGNGWGGFAPDGAYEIDVRPEDPAPAPWANILADDLGGALLTERGGGFFWHGNSRSGRLTPFCNDALREGWGLMLYLAGPGGAWLRLLPGDRPQLPFRVRYEAAGARYAFEAQRLAGAVTFCLRGDRPEACVAVELENRGLEGGGWRLVGFVDWLMGVDAGDGAWLRAWSEGGACYAGGAGGGVGYFAAAEPSAVAGPGRAAFLGRGTVMAPEGLDDPGRSGGWVLSVPLRLERGAPRRVELALGWAADAAGARARTQALRPDRVPALEAARADWAARLSRLTIETPDAALNHIANGFLIHQARSARVCGRTGLYQPGGAYGFRDQLQDMLALLHFEPERVRAHLLRCAARQFEAGDVLHWWHPPYQGVRTRISDDCLFLPWVAAAYVRHTGDAAVLSEEAPYLEDVPLPEGREDVFREMRPGSASGTLHDHCMRAFRRAAGTGVHGLALMGAGDWNDGMNRVGAEGRGESVWLSEFLAACADSYGEVAPEGADRAWLRALADRMRAAVEDRGWDGAWYLRAYGDDGRPLGGAGCRECRIDAISQAWAVLAGLDGARCASAMDAAWRALADGDLEIIRLLDPPFDGETDPGYIRGYPAGVRENGGQYTHGALWLLLALIRMGDGERAHQALRWLLPASHADTREKARVYRLEPYVMAADIYARPPLAGRGGWSWYTGAASWMYVCLLALLGYERRGDRVRLNALLEDWPSAAVTVAFGGSRYRLVCDRETRRVSLDGRPVEGEFIRLRDDGAAHEARFPARG